MKVSVVIPAKNEAATIGKVVTAVSQAQPQAQIIVVDDGSSDATADLAEAAGATVLKHPDSLGNGAAIKTGARFASGDFLVFMDGDGQHSAADIELLLSEFVNGYDIVIGARNRTSQANGGRALANTIFNLFAGYMTGNKIPDLTSGFRAVKSGKFKEFLYLLPNRFSYPTTSTMAFFRAGYPVKYVSINVEKRVGVSHINPLRDGIRFLLIIFKVATLYSPLKIFFPFSVLFFVSGFTYYLFTYFTDGRFTNMGMLLFVTSILIFLIGLVSEQITTLLYKNSN